MGIREGRTIARVEFAILVLLVVTVCSILVGNLARSATGRRFLAVRSNERAGASVGISVANTKLLAFGIASFLAGVGGAFLGYSRGQLSADSFTVMVGLSFLAFAYLGGITTVSGAIIAGTFAPLGIGFVILDRALDIGTAYQILAGIGLVLTAIFNPEGIAGANRKNFDKMRAGLAARAAARAAPANGDDDAGAGTVGPEAAPTAAAPTPRATQRPSFDGAPVVLAINELTVRYGGLKAVDDASLRVREGEIVGLIGPNGAGKTTMIDALTGFIPSEGRIEFCGAELTTEQPYQRARMGLSRTWQSLELFGDLSVRENVQVADERATVSSVLTDFVKPARPVDLARVDSALDLVGLAGDADARPGDLPLGRQKLVGVARALASSPRVMLADEPAAGLDTAESRALGREIIDIAEGGVSILLVDHDMGLVLEVCDYIYVLDFGQIIAEGTPADIRANEAVIDAYLGSEVHT